MIVGMVILLSKKGFFRFDDLVKSLKSVTPAKAVPPPAGMTK
jgi:hypothetical protein